MTAKFPLCIWLLIGLGQCSLLNAESQQPVLKKYSSPYYPTEMARAEVPGAVAIGFIITTSGKVVEAQVLQSTLREFEESALNAVRSWKFTPAEIDGRKVNTQAVQVIEFNMPPTLVYPQELLLRGVSGSATVEYTLDQQGWVTRIRSIKATHPAFGSALAAALSARQFTPALPIKGDEPREETLTVAFNVDGKGDASVSKAAAKLVQELNKNTVYPKESELDEKLKPIETPQPIYPLMVKSSTETNITVIEFYVNASGNVLLPRIVSASEEAFGYAAVQAVNQWTYHPPVKNGRKVTAVKQVQFEFKRS